MKIGDAILEVQNKMKVFRPAWDESRAVEPGAYLTIGEVADPEAPGGKRPAILHHVGVGTDVASRWVDGNMVNDEDLLATDWAVRK